MKDKIIVIVGLLIIAAGLFYAVNFNKVTPSEEAVISSLVGNWKAFEKTIPDRPVLGATTWNYPGIIQIISSDKLLIEYDDGHIVRYSVISYSGKNKFSFVESVGSVN